jgi:hypothetical protein
MAVGGRSGTIAFCDGASRRARDPCATQAIPGSTEGRRTGGDPLGDVRISVAASAPTALRLWATGRPLGAKGRRLGVTKELVGQLVLDGSSNSSPGETHRG